MHIKKVNIKIRNCVINKNKVRFIRLLFCKKRNFCMQVNIFLLCILLQSNVTFFITNDIIGMTIINQHKCENYLLSYSFNIMNSLDFIFILNSLLNLLQVRFAITFHYFNIYHKLCIPSSIGGF